MHRFLSCLIAVLLLEPAPAEAETPVVVASVKPVHSLVASITKGVSKPVLLLKGGGSPHGYALRPSGAYALSRASLVFWIGPGMETFLARPLKALAKQARTVALAETPGIISWPARKGGVWARQESATASRYGRNDDHPRGPIDPHLWLDPANAAAMANTIAKALAEVDPGNAEAYAANVHELNDRIRKLDEELASLLTPMRNRAYVVFHDAYQYFEKRYALRALGAITATPGHGGVGAARLTQIRTAVTEMGARCVFAEPQFRPKMIEVLAQGTPAHVGVLDPLGADLDPGADLYFVLMRSLARNLIDCLAEN